MTTIQCLTCKHYMIYNNTCDAYLKGIPDDVFTEVISHKKNIKGDHGIKWEPIPEMKNNALSPEKTSLEI